ncbi:MAG: tetratricopeptide (TPR) repeat protein, partial [Planctomycetota bacterium]
PAWVRLGLPWICLGLLVLPFHTLWVDAEQVRRGLLLMLTGAALLAFPRLPHVRGERFALIFVGGLIVCALVQAALQNTFHDDGTPLSFQPWEAAYRISHWFALLVIVRIGVMFEIAAIASAISTMVIATSVFGILQRFGLAEINGYGVEREPVSTLGNLNVASEWTSVAGVAVATIGPKVRANLRWLPFAALVLACAYLMVNPSRSGKVAMLAGLALLAVMRRKERGYVPLLIGIGGSLLGVLLSISAPNPEIEGTALREERKRSTVTLDIRLEIATSATALFGESVVFGKGPGQFAVEYPRVRSQAEIEASSFERQFATEVRTAHDDWLELLVDGGLVALILFALMLFSLQRGTRDKTKLVPLFALLLLMLVRAPIGNAPAAAIAFLLVGSPIQVPVRTQRRKLLRIAFMATAGLFLFYLGTLPVAGNMAFTPYLGAMRDKQPTPRDAARNAIGWMSYEPRWLHIEGQNQMNRGDYAKAAHYAARALELRPFSPPLYLLLGEVLAKSSRYGEAIKVAQQGLKLDPANPELRALRSTALAELGDVDRAISAVAVDPHPVLRDGLTTHFASLADRASKRREPKQVLRYAIENTFVTIADLLATGDRDALVQIHAMNEKLNKDIKLAERTSIDRRYPVTMALQAMARGQDSLAGKYAAVAKLRGPITAWQAELLGEPLDRLRQLPEWQGALPSK